MDTYDAETSSGPSAVVKDTGKVAFRFCPECSNMLQPHEDAATDTLVFECSTCHHVEKSLTACIYRNSLKEDVAETPGNVDDVLEDPTVRGFARLNVADDEHHHHDEEGDFDDEDDIDDEDDMEDVLGHLEAPDVDPIMCTMCGQEIMCPTCGRPTDRCLALEVEDPGEPASNANIRAERMERQLSSGAVPGFK